ncbi:SDR family NAD(P)-dependent oxidoreductase, partial [Pseudomonas aeruginosa]
MLFTSKPLSPQGRHVLITGASSGLGRETALHLAEQGFQVIAGVRRQEDGERLANACPSGRISTLLIDVTDEESIGRAAAQVAEKVGDTGLWGLVNNAGICISAPLECVSSDLLRRQLEVNLIGQLAVTRAILPLLRRGGAARLVNVTSGLGSVAIPYLGAYSAAQFAKEGVSDALRRELAPMGIQVSVVSPGAIWTPIWGKIASEGERALADAPDAVADLYRDTYLRFLQAN